MNLLTVKTKKLHFIIHLVIILIKTKESVI